LPGATVIRHGGSILEEIIRRNALRLLTPYVIAATVPSNSSPSSCFQYGVAPIGLSMVK